MLIQYLLHFGGSFAMPQFSQPLRISLGPMPFNIFINDLCLINLDSEICNFADDNTIFSCGNELHEIVTVLENYLSILLEWFKCNGMVVNPKKFQLLFLGLKRKQGLLLNIKGSKIVAMEHVQLLRN